MRADPSRCTGVHRIPGCLQFHTASPDDCDSYDVNCGAMIRRTGKFHVDAIMGRPGGQHRLAIANQWLDCMSNGSPKRAGCFATTRRRGGVADQLVAPTGSLRLDQRLPAGSADDSAHPDDGCADRGIAGYCSAGDARQFASPVGSDRVGHGRARRRRCAGWRTSVRASGGRLGSSRSRSRSRPPSVSRWPHWHRAMPRRRFTRAPRSP